MGSETLTGESTGASLAVRVFSVGEAVDRLIGVTTVLTVSNRCFLNCNEHFVPFFATIIHTIAPDISRESVKLHCDGRVLDIVVVDIPDAETESAIAIKFRRINYEL